MMPVPGDEFGRYTITGQLGRGAMGVVFAARHRDLERDVALKLMVPELAGDDEYRLRFLREARILARLDSSHVVRVFDAGEHHGWLFIATEVFRDGDLGALMSSPELTPRVAVDVIAQVATGLSDAHRAGLLHRDLKPSNVLVRRRPAGGWHAVICDFGVATEADSTGTLTQGMIGTPAYLAPERFDGVDASISTDVYALGCLLYAVLVGRPPYVGPMAQVIAGHIRGAVPPLPPTLAGRADLERVLAGAMAKQPAQRFASADAVAVALRHVRFAPPTPSVAATEVDPAQVARHSQMTAFGTPAVPVEPASSLPPPGAVWQQRTELPPAGARPKRGVLALAGVLGVLLVAGVVTMLVALGRNAPDESADRGRVAPLSGPTSSAHADASTPGVDPGAATPTDQGSDPSTDRPTRAASVMECWDSSRAQRCSRPRGSRGFLWVFPGADGPNCVRPRSAPPSRPDSKWCSFGSVTVHYTRWRSWTEMNTYYSAPDQRLGLVDVRPDLHAITMEVRQPTAQGEVFEAKIGAWYRDSRAPYSVTVYAHDVDAARRALRNLMLRPSRAVVEGGEPRRP